MSSPTPRRGEATRPPRQWVAWWIMARYSLLTQIRTPAGLIFGFIFPIVFISIFGLIGNGSSTVKVGVPTSISANDPLLRQLSAFPIVQIERGSESDLRARLTGGKLDSVLLISGHLPAAPGGGRVATPAVGSPVQVTLLTSTANPRGGSTASAVVRQFVDMSNLRLAGVKNPAIAFAAREVSGRTFRYIDFALPGQIGFSLLSTAVFSTAFGFIFLKKGLVFKRLFATPVRPASVLLAQAASRLIVALLQAILIVVLGVVAFQFYLPHGLLTLGGIILLSLFGLICFLGFGLFIAGIARDENSVAPVSNLITLPQFLLSGTFFSTDSFPSVVQVFANALPLTFFNQAMRKLATEGAGLEVIWPSLLGLGAWALVSYVAAARTFRWQ